jgi:hypothetical protein
MNLPFETEVAFEVPVMFANSCNVSFEKAETGKRGSRLSYTPTMLIPKPETTSLLIPGISRQKVGSSVEVRPSRMRCGRRSNPLAVGQTARPLRDLATSVILEFFAVREETAPSGTIQSNSQQ